LEIKLNKFCQEVVPRIIGASCDSRDKYNISALMKKLVLLLLFFLGCQKNDELNSDSLFEYATKINHKPYSTDFFFVHRSSNQYLYRSNDYDVEFWLTVNDDSLSPAKFYKARKDSSEKFLRAHYPDNYVFIINLLEKDIKFYAFLAARYNLKAINARNDKDSTLEICYTFKNDSDLIYSGKGIKNLKTNKEVIKIYSNNWLLQGY
jgi:hypothetical protein